MTIGAFAPDAGTTAIVPLPKGEIAAARGLGYGARIGELNVRLATHPEFPLRQYTRDSLAPRVADQSSVYENTLDLGYTFSRQDLTGGAGLDWFPRRNVQTVGGAVTDEIRFWDSRNIDVSRTQFDSEYVLRLHKKIVVWQDYGGNVATAIGRTPDRIYIGQGLQIDEHQTLTNTTPIPPGTVGLPAAVDELWNLGFDMYALLTNGEIWRKLKAEAVFTLWNDGSGNDTFTNMWTVKGRVVAQLEDGTTGKNELVEVTDAGAPYAAFDNFPAGTSVQAVVDAGPIIIAAVTDGYLYSYQLTSDGSDLLEVVSQTELPDGEAPITIAYNQGLVFYATADEISATETVLRGYVGEVLDSRFNFVVGNSQLLFETQSNVDLATGGFSDVLVTRDEIWWAIYETNQHQVPEQVSLFRIDVATQGLNRGNSFDVTGAQDPADLNVFEGRKLWIQDGDVYIEDEDVFAGGVGQEAWLVYPNINFGLNTDINWISSVFDVGSLAAQGVQAELYRSQDSGAIFDATVGDGTPWVLQQRVTSPGTSGNEFEMVGVTAKQLTLQVRLFPHSQGLASPTIRRVSIRGLPKARDWIVELPVNVSDYIEVPYRRPVRIPKWGNEVHRAIQLLSGAHIELLVFDPPMGFVGVVDAIDQPVTYSTHLGSVQKVCMVRFRGNKITAPQAPTGDAGSGLGLLGVVQLGVGQSKDT